MKAAILMGNRDIQIKEIAKPELGKGAVMVQVKAVGVCGTDLHTYKSGCFKEMCIPVADGLFFGHEFAGIATEISPGLELEDIEVGDRVTGIALGAYSEYTRVGSDFFGEPWIFKLPDNVSFEEAATTEPLTVSLAGVRRAEPKPGEKILIIGAGMIGLGCIQVIKALYPGCEIIVSDVSQKRLDIAKAFGADRVINVAQEDLIKTLKADGEEAVFYSDRTSGQVDVVIECAGLNVTLNNALELTRPHTGRLLMLALYEDQMKVDANLFVSKNLNVLGALGNYGPDDFKQSIDLMASGKVDRKSLITHRFDLAETREAFEVQLKTGECLKAVVTNE